MGLKLDKELTEIFEDAGFDTTLLKGNAGYFIEILQYTPENEAWTEMLFVGDATFADIADSVSERISFFNINDEFNARKDEIGTGHGFPQTAEELKADIRWMKDKLKELYKGLEKYDFDTRSAIIKERNLERE